MMSRPRLRMWLRAFAGRSLRKRVILLYGRNPSIIWIANPIVSSPNIALSARLSTLTRPGLSFFLPISLFIASKLCIVCVSLFQCLCSFAAKLCILHFFRYTDMQTCLSPLPEVSEKEETAGRALEIWPDRVNAVPPRVYLGTIKGVTSETFKEDSELWRKRLSYYKKVNNQIGKPGRYRNLLDMNAYLGGFAAALIDYPVWVMNVIPVQAKVNTLGVIYERGLIGTYQDWWAQNALCAV